METQGWQRHAKSRIHPKNSASIPVGQVLESIQCISVYAQYQWQQPMQMTKLSTSPLYVESPHSFQKHQESVNYNVLQCIPNSMSDMLEQTMLQTHHRELCCTLTLDTAIQQTHRNVHASQQRLWRAKTNRTRGQATHNRPSMSD